MVVRHFTGKTFSAVLLILLAPLRSFSQSINDPMLPSALGSLKLSVPLQGRGAQGLINRLHDKSVAPAKTSVGYYVSPEGEATLYVSTYKTRAEAASVMSRMASRIKAGNEVFTNYSERTVLGQRLVGCSGLDQAHYVFSRKRNIYWLSADFGVAQQALESLLGKLP